MAEANSKKTARAPKVTIVSNNPPKQEAKPKAAVPSSASQSAPSAQKKKAAKAPAPSVRVNAPQPSAAKAQAEHQNPAPKPKAQPEPQAPQAQQEVKADPQVVSQVEPHAQPQEVQPDPQPSSEEAGGIQTTPQTAAQKMGTIQQSLKDKINGMAHPHAFYFGVLGLVLALLIFWIGFFRTLLIVLLVVVGVAIGQWYDGDPKIINAIKRLVARVAPRDEDGGLS